MEQQDRKSKGKYQLYIKTACLLFYDMAAIAASGFLALWIKFDFQFGQVDPRFLETAWHYLPHRMITTVALFFLFRLYGSLWSYAGMVELEGIFTACFLSGLAQLGYIHLLRGTPESYPLPRSYYVLYCACLFGLTAGSRFLYRLLRLWYRRMLRREAGQRVMVVGAGETGHVMVREIHSSRQIHKRVCCVIDDDRQKKGSYVYGVRVAGGREEIAEAVRKYRITEIILAVPSADRKSLRELAGLCRATGCPVQILPGMAELISGQVALERQKDSGREADSGLPPRIDEALLRQEFSGKTVLVTGGGGFMGSELCRQVAACAPARLVLVDIYENSVYEVQQELKAVYPQLPLEVRIASVRSVRQLEEIFSRFHPQIVLHAAFYKKKELMEESPEEALKNNVFGSWKLLHTAGKYRAEKVLLLSDDGCGSRTVTDASMRLCERLAQAYGMERSAPVCAAVRFACVKQFSGRSDMAALLLQTCAVMQGGELFELDRNGTLRLCPPVRVTREELTDGLEELAEILRQDFDREEQLLSLHRKLGGLVPEYGSGGESGQ